MHLRFLGFLILHVSHKSNVSFSSISLLIDLFFKVGVPPFASNKALKNILKSPANITLWLWLFSKLDSIVVSSLRTQACSFSVLALGIFISKKSKSSIGASKTRNSSFFVRKLSFNCYILVTIESYQNSAKIRWTMKKMQITSKFILPLFFAINGRIRFL